MRLSDRYSTKKGRREVNEHSGKLPQYQMLWNDQGILRDLVNLVLFQVESYRNNRAEKDRIIGLFRRFAESFFEQPVERTCEFGCFSASEISHLLSDNLVKWRLAKPNVPLEEIIGSMKSEYYQEEEEKMLTSEQRKAKTGRNRNQKLLTHITGYTGECGRNPNLTFNDELFFEKVKPTLNGALFIPLKNPGCNVLYAPQHFYGFVRYLFCLYDRLYRARAMIHQSILQEMYRTPEKASAFINEFYSDIFLKAVRTCINGTIDVTKYEEFCRHYLGQQAYLLFTVENLTSSVLLAL
eukprot:TRINITY_DN2432_c0_g2_i2.p2 TRINITY_DN2432_c0_g2~~TRINITY_DN2432_c0_g2_i2.p2  ORF type:complete len:296 (-),score=83.10 TRINITY_DN2432_c0_g2_i2:672-1559(-)